MREELGVAHSGLETVVRGAFSLLELIAFFTAGEDKPAQSWHLRHGLSVWHAAGMIHSDIQRGFVRAEVVGWEQLVERRRLRRRPRPRHAAARGPRLRRRRRRRDHRPVHPVGVGQRPATGAVNVALATLSEAECHVRRAHDGQRGVRHRGRAERHVCRRYSSLTSPAPSSRSASRRSPSARAAAAPPGRSVARSAGRSTATVRSVAMSRNARSSEADSFNAAATFGRSPSAPAIAPSSDPYRSSRDRPRSSDRSPARPAARPTDRPAAR